MGEKRYGYLDASPENLSTRGLKIIVAAYSIGSVRSRSKQEVLSLSFFSPTGQVGPASNYSRRNHVTIVRIRERHLA